jgi:hypothetical protein
MPEQVIAADKLEALTGLSASRHAALAKAGYFPKAIRGNYLFAATLRGLFRYFREQTERRAAVLPNAKPEIPEKVESMQAAASLLGYRVEAIASAKAAGCLAFKLGGRIDLFELEEWFALHPEIKSLSQDEITILQAERIELVAKALTRRENYARMRRELVRASDVRRDNGRAYLAFRAKLLLIASSVSQKLALLTDANEIDVELRKRIREALGELCKSPWRGECPHCGKEVV